MKTITTSVLLLFMTAFSLMAQTDVQSYLEKYNERKAMVIEHYLNSINHKSTTQKSASFSEAFYDLEYNLNTLSWDTLLRNTILEDTVNKSQIWLSERWTPTGYVYSDSGNFYIADTNKYYKVYGKEASGLVSLLINSTYTDSASFYTLDSSGTNWNLVIKELKIPNSNGDLAKSELYFDFLAALGGPSTNLILSDRLSAFYDSNNDLRSIITEGSDFFTGIPTKYDSIICTPNSNDYRAIDSIYNWDDSTNQWFWEGRRSYTYDARNNLVIDELDSNYLRKISWDVNDRRLTDSVFEYFGGTYDLGALRRFTYTANGLDSILTYSVFGSATFLLDVESHHYNINNKLDSVVSFDYDLSSNISYGSKQAYVRQPFVVGIDKFHQKTDDFQLYPNPSNGLIRINSQENQIDLQVFDLRGKELLRMQERGSFTLDLTELSTGIYLLKLNDQVKKIIIE